MVEVTDRHADHSAQTTQGERQHKNRQGFALPVFVCRESGEELPDPSFSGRRARGQKPVPVARRYYLFSIS